MSGYVPDWPVIWSTVAGAVAGFFSGGLAAFIKGWFSKRNTDEINKTAKHNTNEINKTAKALIAFKAQHEDQLATPTQDRERELEKLKAELAREHLRLERTLDTLKTASHLVLKMHDAAFRAIPWGVEELDRDLREKVVGGVEALKEMEMELQVAGLELPQGLRNLAWQLSTELRAQITDTMGETGASELMRARSDIRKSRERWKAAVEEAIHSDELKELRELKDKESQAWLLRSILGFDATVTHLSDGEK